MLTTAETEMFLIVNEPLDHPTRAPTPDPFAEPLATWMERSSNVAPSIPTPNNPALLPASRRPEIDLLFPS